MIRAVEELRDGQSENIETRGDAGCFLSTILTYNFVAYLHFWVRVLNEINDSQKYLQTHGLGLDVCASKMQSLLSFLAEERDSVVLEAHAAAVAFCEEMNIFSMERRIRKKKRACLEKR